jgi:hypothetical protein
MNCEEVKISIHDFVDELLDPNRQKEIEAHLRLCDNCFGQYKRIRKFYDKLKDIPYTIDPPGNIVEIFSNELLKKSVEDSKELKPKSKLNLKKIKSEQLKQDQSLKNTRGVVRKSMVSQSIYTTRLIKPMQNRFSLDLNKTLLTLLPLVLFGIGYYIYDFTLINTPWKVRTISGSVLVNGKPNASERIDEGESLVTEAMSKAVINVPNTGRIEVGQNSFIILLKAKDGSNRIKILNGGITINNSATIPSLAIEVNNSVVYDRGGTFNIIMDENGDAKVSVEFGFVEIEQKGRSYFVDEGHICELRNSFHPGTPFKIDAPEEIKSAIKKLDYENGGDSTAVEIISKATIADALTLLAMIPRVSEQIRETLFNKISSYYLPPKGVDLEGIKKLDKSMLELWWNEIEWQI